MEKNKIDEHLKSGPTTTIIIGQSGSGKGTIVRMLKNYLQEIDSSHAVVGIEMGDLFRSWIPTLSEWRRKEN
jgi:ABC-type polar amino acid transport system ATPase subunit